MNAALGKQMKKTNGKPWRKVSHDQKNHHRVVRLKTANLCLAMVACSAITQLCVVYRPEYQTRFIYDWYLMHWEVNTSSSPNMGTNCSAETLDKEMGQCSVNGGRCLPY